MVNSFINPAITTASKLGVSAFEDMEAIELRPGWSEAEADTVIRAVYRQVLGNTYVMESERLTVSESHLKSGEISVCDFVREVALSDLYRSRFFDSCPRNRSIELNFKHLLGRAPESYEEITEHTQILDRDGYEAEIDSYIESDEYQSVFGENRVPYYRGYKTQTGKNIVGFTHMFKLLRGASGSDKASSWGNHSQLNRSIMSDRPSAIVPLSGVPASWKPTWRPSSQLTDVNQLIANVLNFKTHESGSPIKTRATSEKVSEADRDVQSQYRSFEDTDPIELWPGRSEEEAEIAIRAVYRQVLGNAHVMESEREQLSVAESQLKLGEISVREFVRWVAKSELYRSRFFDNCPRYRAIELNFKHLLGRAPDDYSETFYHSSVLDKGGFEAEIDSYLDSNEYQDAFGENTVPFYRGYKTQTGKKLLGFTNMFKLLPSLSASDKSGLSGNLPRLDRSLINNNPAGKAPVTDIGELLAKVLKPKVQPAVPAPADITRSEAYQALRRQCQEQAELLETLRQQLAELQPFAAIGNAQLSKWQSSRTPANGSSNLSHSGQFSSQSGGIARTGDSYQALQQQSEEQKAAIAALQQEIADARPLATIGEARLNKWRSRSFG